MSIIRQQGVRYKVKDKDCLGRNCLRLGHYQVRGGTMSGSRNTGQVDPCCLTRAYHGCPTQDETYQIDESLLKQRQKEGMKIT